MLLRPQPDILDSDALSADCVAIACRVIVTARVVGDVFMGAIYTARDMTPESRCSAALDCVHDLELAQADAPLVCRPPSRAVVL